MRRGGRESAQLYLGTFKQKTTSPFGYSSTGGELCPQQESLSLRGMK